ncbi:MAG: hypothetical protein R3F60_32475 [bacterium]
MIARRLALAAGLLAAPAALACLNNTEIRRDEQQFRARYADAPPPAPPADHTRLAGWLLAGLGAAGLALAFRADRR